MNLSLKNLRGERWKPISGYEGKYAISSRGRVKRLSGWTDGAKPTYWGEQIIGIKCAESDEESKRYLSAVLNRDG